MKNWKTTLMGAATAGLYAAFALAQRGTLSPQELVICFGLAFMGALAKDANVTGGTIPATSEAAGRVDTVPEKPSMLKVALFALKNRKKIEAMFTPAPLEVKPVEQATTETK